MIKFLFKRSFIISIIIALCLILSMFYNLIVQFLLNNMLVFSKHFLQVTNSTLWVFLTIIMIISFISFVVRMDNAIKSKYQIRTYFNNKSNVWNIINLMSSLFSVFAIKIVNLMFSNRITNDFSSTTTEHYIILAAISFLVLVMIPLFYVGFVRFSSDMIIEEQESVDLELWMFYFSRNVQVIDNPKEKEEKKRLSFLDFIKKVYFVLHEIGHTAESRFKLKNKLNILSILKRTKPVSTYQ